MIFGLPWLPGALLLAAFTAGSAPVLSWADTPVKATLAETPQQPARSGEGALPEYAHHLNAAPLLYGHFTQEKIIQGIKKPLVSRGDFLVAKDKGVIWRTQSPFASAVAITSKGLWALEGGDSTRAPRRSPLSQGNLGATMGMIERILSGDPAGLEKNFDVKTGGTDSAWTLRLTPKDPTWARFARSVALSGGARVDSVEYLEANGDRTRIHFTGVGEGGGALASWFGTAFRD